jgi:Na+/proline symporter
VVAIIGLASISLACFCYIGKGSNSCYYEQNYLPIGLKGLAITAFFALIMSTADSELNAAILLTEYRSKQKSKEQKLVNKINLEIDGMARGG